ncbi:MAG: sugar ABC transporter ATP-binding protein [Nitriliruptorales bacterium]|nr:sugar ABC transporter ATP-binding protein [Nitriliruptorales bacterium]
MTVSVQQPRVEQAPPIIEGHGLVKRFGGAVAVDGVDIEVRPGDVHAVVGENGAGKSTLMRMLSGILRPSEGTVLVDGQPLEMGSAKAALEAGIALVHQELSLVPEMTVAENIVLGFTPTREAGFIDRSEQSEIAQAALDEIGVRVDLDEPVARLSVALRQFVEIARAVARQPRVLILDEPTATLTPAETDYLLEMLERLADRGMAIIYISHRIPEIFAICKRVTILRDGERVHAGAIDSLTPGEMVDLMVGRELKSELETRRDSVEPGEVVLSARGITAPGVNGVDLDVRAGQIVGLGGLVGAGRTELVRAIIGADPRTSGTATLNVDGETFDIRSYRQAVDRGLAYVPEERRSDGLALTMTVKDNITLPNRGRLSRFAVLLPGKIKRFAQRLADAVELRPPIITAEVGSYSGGNQQKVVLAKWLGHEPRFIVLDEPTRGVDVGAKAEIHRLVRGLADEGTAVLVVSSDLPELLELADIIHVVRDGVIVGTLPRDVADESSVMALASGGTSLIGA